MGFAPTLKYGEILQASELASTTSRFGSQTYATVNGQPSSKATSSVAAVMASAAVVLQAIRSRSNPGSDPVVQFRART
jgi:hypothetical protein